MAEPRRAALAQREGANSPRAIVAQLATALRFLTIVPVGGATVPVGQSALFFPVVGLGLGAALLAADLALTPVAPAGLRSVIVVALLVVLTRARHLHGLASTADGLLAGDRARALAIMREHTTGAFGALVLVLVLALKMRSLDAAPAETRAAALLLAPMLGRWAIVVLAFGSLPARPDGVGFTMVRSLTFREFGIATVVALWVTLAATAARGLVAALVVASVTIGCRILTHRKLGGVTGDALGAIAEVTEALVLTVFALGVPPTVALA